MTQTAEQLKTTIRLVKFYANKAGLDEQMCIDRYTDGKVTMAELSQGILGKHIDD